MRVSGRKLRLAVGAGIVSLMMVLGVSPVGATAPQSVGLVNVIVVGAQASGSNSTNVLTTNTTYRDAVRITNVGLNGPTYDDCVFNEVGNVNNQGTPNQPKPATSAKDVGLAASVGGCGLTIPIVAPAAYPLWENQTSGGTNVLVVPPTGVPGNKTVPQKSYIIETFR
jgi:hypothetical protein